MTLDDYLRAERGRGTALATALGVPPESVSQWRNGVRAVPAERCPDVERATSGAVRCEDMRPDIDWAILREKPSPAGPKKAAGASKSATTSDTEA